MLSNCNKFDDQLENLEIKRAYKDCKAISEVLLISMPFGPLLTPSIGLSLLKSSLETHNVSSKIIYFTLQFADLIGPDLYLAISNGYPATYDLLGEWIFSQDLYKSTSFTAEDYIEDILRGKQTAHRKKIKISENFIANILHIRNKTANFLNHCLEEIISHSPRVVAFTSVFQQHVASLCLAKLLKAQYPDVFVIFGGANCEAIMGLETASQFSFIDAVISGEGDIIFPKLVFRVLNKQDWIDLPGVFTSEAIKNCKKESHVSNTPVVENLDSIPFPNYDEFFEQLKNTSFNNSQINRQVRILFETSRGCWWGEKRHCTFCGLNGVNMQYRSKSVPRALDEILYLHEKYSNHPLSAVDNILDMKYFHQLFPELASKNLDLELFYEVKSNLNKSKLKLLKDAGVRGIQPGIESLSNQILDLMRKGVSALQNIQLLKWCKEFGITPYWNILWGFPGESPEEYEHMTKLIPLLSHLPPPKSVSSLRLDRFSPNFDQSKEFGFFNVSPYPSYQYVYPLPKEAVANLAYYFSFNYQDDNNVEAYTSDFAKEVDLWKTSYHESDLFFVDKNTQLLIWDFRIEAVQNLYVLRNIQKILYEICDSIKTIDNLLPIVKSDFPNSDFTLIESLLKGLVDKGLMLNEDNRYLSLGIPLGEYSPSAPILKKLQEKALQLGKEDRGKIVIELDDCQAII